MTTTAPDPGGPWRIYDRIWIPSWPRLVGCLRSTTSIHSAAATLRDLFKSSEGIPKSPNYWGISGQGAGCRSGNQWISCALILILSWPNSDGCQVKGNFALADEP